MNPTTTYFPSQREVQQHFESGGSIQIQVTKHKKVVINQATTELIFNQEPETAKLADVMENGYPEAIRVSITKLKPKAEVLWDLAFGKEPDPQDEADYNIDLTTKLQNHFS